MSAWWFKEAAITHLILCHCTGTFKRPVNTLAVFSGRQFLRINETDLERPSFHQTASIYLLLFPFVSQPGFSVFPGGLKSIKHEKSIGLQGSLLFYRDNFFGDPPHPRLLKCFLYCKWHHYNETQGTPNGLIIINNASCLTEVFPLKPKLKVIKNGNGRQLISCLQTQARKCSTDHCIPGRGQPLSLREVQDDLMCEARGVAAWFK